MFEWIIKKIIGTKNQRTVKRLQPIVAEINRLEAHLQNETDEALRERCANWKAQFRAFHTPKFLGGVSLRIATEEQVDACLSHVAGYFGALKQHFPSLDGAYLAESAWAGKSLDDKKARIDQADTSLPVKSALSTASARGRVPLPQGGPDTCPDST